MDSKLMESILFGDHLKHSKVAPAAGLLFKIHRKYSVEQPAAFLPAKKETTLHWKDQ